jgi:two-component system phosphate regulon sensor histidine kinase PhoR
MAFPLPDRAIIEALPEPALIVADGIVRMSNKAASAALGAHIEGEDVRLAIRHPAAVERLLSDRAEASEEIELVGVGEPDRRWMMSVTPLNKGASFVRLIDRSEAHAAERMRVDFVANASHELRTPLASLIGYAETIIDSGREMDAETRERFLGIMFGEARRMQRIVEDLISLSRIEAERFNPPREAVDILPLIEAARENCSLVASERGCPIHVEAGPDLEPVAGDRSQLLQVLDNLISNALRYGRDGSPVTVSAERAGKMLRLAVTDRGEGIPARHIPRLTERFYRVDASRSRAAGGTGLGLAIVKHIVERHRGTLEIRSRIGEGTSVEVALPLAN